MNVKSLLLTLLGLAAAPLALAQDDDDDTDPRAEDTSEQPDPPVPEIPDPIEDSYRYAGVGSDIAYGEAGVIEAGGSMAFSSTGLSTAFAIDPMVGYFIYDNIELSAILGARYLNVEGGSETRLSLMLEPSLHYPLTDQIFLAGGLGLGVATASPGLNANDDITVGFAMAPRIGTQFLVGRSGLLNLGARYAMTFTDAEGDVDPYQGRTVLAFVNAFEIQAGYTVMF